MDCNGGSPALASDVSRLSICEGVSITSDGHSQPACEMDKRSLASTTNAATCSVCSSVSTGNGISSPRLCAAIAPSSVLALSNTNGVTAARSMAMPIHVPAGEFPEVVELNVGGHFFTTRLSTLRKDEGSMLAAMFSGRHCIDRDSAGRYFIDRDGGENFSPILNYLRHGELPRVERALDVYHEALYYNLGGLIAWCETQPNVIAEMMYKHAREWLGPSYSVFKNKLLESARKRFTTNPESYLDDKTGYFDLTFAFTRPNKTGRQPSDSVQESATKCSEHTFAEDTPKFDAVLPAGLDLDMTLNFLRRDFHEAGLSTEWSPIYSYSKSTCQVCQVRVYFLYFRVVLWHWVATPASSPGNTAV